MLSPDNLVSMVCSEEGHYPSDSVVFLFMSEDYSRIFMRIIPFHEMLSSLYAEKTIFEMLQKPETNDIENCTVLIFDGGPSEAKDHGEISNNAIELFNGIRDLMRFSYPVEYGFYISNGVGINIDNHQEISSVHFDGLGSLEDVALSMDAVAWEIESGINEGIPSFDENNVEMLNMSFEDGDINRIWEQVGSGKSVPLDLAMASLILDTEKAILAIVSSCIDQSSYQMLTKREKDFILKGVSNNISPHWGRILNIRDYLIVCAENSQGIVRDISLTMIAWIQWTMGDGKKAMRGLKVLAKRCEYAIDVLKECSSHVHPWSVS